MFDAVFLLNTAKLLINSRLLYTCNMLVEFNSFDGTPVGERFKDYGNWLYKIVIFCF
jgi:hypothetical protein